MRSVRVILPPHLRLLAGTAAEVIVAVQEPATLGSVLEAVETAHPELRGTIRDRASGCRRPFIRVFALGEDLSFLPDDEPLPEAVREGREPLRIVGAIAGGAPGGARERPASPAGLAGPRDRGERRPPRVPREGASGTLGGAPGRGHRDDGGPSSARLSYQRPVAGPRFHRRVRR